MASVIQLGRVTRGLASLGVFWFVVGAAATPAQGLEPRIANGVETTDQPTTGALLAGSGGFQICSGTMVGCRTFLTAAHCVCDENGSTCNPDESTYQVYLQHAGRFSVSQITPNPNFIDFPSAENDIAVVTLSSEVTGIRPTPLAGSPPAFGTSGTIAGFGSVTDLPASGSGIKREGRVVTTSCAPSGASDTQFVCWEFSPPFGAPGTDSNTCPGDSGGPLFTSEGGTTVIAGVASFGLRSCTGDDFAGDSNVATYASWVASVAGSDITETSCGALPQVGDVDTVVTGFSGTLANASSEQLHTFDVPQGAQELRVTLNGQDDADEDFDLWLRFGAPPTASENDCVAESITQFEACRFVNPTAGTWYAIARSVGGSGDYQVTATSFGNAAVSVCGDFVVTPPETCDDGNTLSGDGCDALCRTESATIGCPAVPDVGCSLQVDSKLKLRRGRRLGKDRLSWKWRGPPNSPPSAGMLGDPRADTDYYLCLYDETAGIASLAFESIAPAGPQWSANSKGFRFKGTQTPGSLDQLRVGTRSRVKLKAKAREIPALPLSQDGSVIAQLRNDTGACWESRYAAPARKNDARRFSDRAQ